jgi:hypothetical protein
VEVALAPEYVATVRRVQEDHIDERVLAEHVISQMFVELDYFEAALNRPLPARGIFRIHNSTVSVFGVEPAVRELEGGIDWFEPGGRFWRWVELLSLDDGWPEAMATLYISRAEGLIERLRGME